MQKEFLKELEKTIALVAYEDHLTCPGKELLDKSRWFKTASEVNAAIFTSQTDENGNYSTLYWLWLNTASEIMSFYLEHYSFPNNRISCLWCQKLL